MDISIYIPSYKTGIFENFQYWIITERKFPIKRKGKLPYEVEFINVPKIKDYVTSLEIVRCECSCLITYKVGEKFYTIPNHEVEFFGQPIFVDEECCRNEENPWDCPQNYFTTESSAKAMLDYLKNTYGCFTSDEIYDFYDYIAPYGCFN